MTEKGIPAFHTKAKAAAERAAEEARAMHDDSQALLSAIDAILADSAER